MKRNQLYLFTIIYIVILILTFSSNIFVLNRELKLYSDYYGELGKIYKLQNFEKLYRNLITFKDKDLIPIVIYYNCSFNNVSIPNYIDDENATIIDIDLKILKTISDENYINFTIENGMVINEDKKVCVFYGYITSFGNTTSQIQNAIEPLSIIRYNFSMINIDEFFLTFPNVIDKDLEIIFYNDTLILKLRKPYLEIRRKI